MVKRLIALLVFATTLSANELTVDKKALQLDDSVEITLALEGSFASLDPPKLPVQNLVIDGSPSVSAEFQWINGVTSRRRVFHYNAHPNAPGAARVGPLTLRDAAGVQLTLPAVTLYVAAGIATDSVDPIRIMRELLATEREPIFILATADKRDVYEGEEILVTWTLYAAANVQQYSLGNIPKLEDFWTEEMQVRTEQPEQVMLGEVPAQRLVVRRAALFPLRSGTLTVGPMTVHASVMKRMNRGDPFGMFEGVMSDVNRRSPPITIDVKPLPPGPPVIAVTNTLNLLCTGPAHKGGGPAFFDVTMSGRANLRAAEPPLLPAGVRGSVQIVNRGTAMVYPVSRDVWMTRRWRYLIFPSESGTLKIPVLSAAYLTPAGERREARCEAKTLEVSSASPAAGGAAAPPVRRLPSRRVVEPIMAVVALVVLILALLPRFRRQSRLRRAVAELVHETPGETRDAVERDLSVRGIEPSQLIRETSDRGDAFRAFRSLVDAAEHDRIPATKRDISHRVRDLLVAIAR
jgi:hypothetical protein